MHFTAPQCAVTVRVFSKRFPCTARSARLARRVTAATLDRWEVANDIRDRAEAVVAELATNAAVHAWVRGRGFRVALRWDMTRGVLLLEVTDARGDRALPRTATSTDERHTEAESESGRGLLMVAALADRWGARPHPPSGKTVWVELDTAGL
ncbi:ATP-binding protein [Streptomyces sp. NBC_00690]|uniref:ATP-binding protein n=1 Tax=Streptomyces sp. NBC_00690 TaxID=2975808 RepID=UPI002E2B0107|nr:ATP-binding protein [Streptomyces sp. NBC_00690]